MWSLGFLCACINGRGRSNYGTNEAGKEICQPSRIEWNIAEKYWILQQTRKTREGCVRACRRGGVTDSAGLAQSGNYVWMLLSVYGTQQQADQRVKGAILV